MRYLTLLFFASVLSVYVCDATAAQLSVEANSSARLSRKQVTVHNCDSAGEA